MSLSICQTHRNWRIDRTARGGKVHCMEGIPNAALDLLDKLTYLDPDKRIPVDEALNHDYFWNGKSFREDVTTLPNFNIPDAHMLTT